MLISGKKAIKIKTTTITTKNIIVVLNASLTDISAIEVANNKHNPYGGVINPIARDTTTTIPNCNSGILKDLVTGRITGINRIIAGIASINVPIIRNIPIITSNNEKLPEAKFVRKTSAAFGT